MRKMTIEEFKERVLNTYPDATSVKFNDDDDGGFFMISSDDPEFFYYVINAKLFPEIDLKGETLNLSPWQPICMGLAHPGTIINVAMHDDLNGGYMNAVVLHVNRNSQMIKFVREDGKIDWGVNDIRYLRYKPNLTFNYKEG